MPLKLGTTGLGGCYHGTTPISAIYKGTTLVYSSGTWEQWYQEFLYNALIPTTINSKQVKNKARIETVYGNSVVENQLVQNGNFENTDGWYSSTTYYTSISVLNNIATITKIASGSGLVCYKANTGISYQINHQLLAVAKIKPSRDCHLRFRLSSYQTGQNITANVWNTLIYLVKPTSLSGIYFGIEEVDNLLQVNDTVNIKEVELIDLTQMFPFYTPTTLYDTRVQELLNRGYIPYNAGEIKSVNIGEISSTKTDTTALQTITFKYQGSGVGTAHDTMEITSTAYVFTKTMHEVDLGSLTYGNSTVSGNSTAQTQPTNMKRVGSNSDVPNFLSTWGLPKSYNETWTGKVVSCDVEGRLWVKLPDNPNETGANIKVLLNGYLLKYELATPQVISIPKKHLGIVDLGTLNWRKSTNHFFAFLGNNAQIPSNNTTKANLYCNSYLLDTVTHVNDETTNNTIGLSISKNISIYDSSKSNLTAQQLGQSLSGQYLFYETENEVADITTQIGIQAGGTITSDSVVLPNIEFGVKCK